MMFVREQTHTSVHSKGAMLGQRQGEVCRNHFTLSAQLLYAQVVIGLSLVVYRQVSTPGYLAVVMLLPGLAVLYFLSCRLAVRVRVRKSLPGRMADLVLFACLFLDAQMSLYAFTSVVREILPDYNSALICAVSLACVLPTLHKQHGHALPALARLIKYPLLIGLGVCMLGALPTGHTAHLFPLLGNGVGSIWQGSLWLFSALSAALTPLYIRKPPQGLRQKRQGFCSLACGLLLGGATALISAWLLPFHFLKKPDSLGAQLLLAVKVNPALVSWSVMVCMMLLLLLISLAASLSRGLHLLSHVTGRPVGWWPAVLLVPLPALSTDAAQQILMRLAPVRTGCMLAALLLLGIGCIGRKEEKTG